MTLIMILTYCSPKKESFHDFVSVLRIGAISVSNPDLTHFQLVAKRVPIGA